MRGRVDKRGLGELAVIPELEPVEVVGTELNVVVHTSVLEEELRIGPEGADVVGAGDNPADKVVFAILLRRGVKGEDLEHDRVPGNRLNLVLEIVLIFVGPSKDIVRLKLQLEGPVRVLFFVAILVELGHFHDGGATDVIGHRSQVLANGVLGTYVVHLTKDSDPSVLEEVERRLAVERKHCKDVS